MKQSSFDAMQEKHSTVDAVNARIRQRNIYMQVISKLLNIPYVKMQNVKK